MKLRFIAATLAVMAMSTTSIMAEGLQGTPGTPMAIVDSQKDSASILPEQYKSYATTMNTVVKDYKNGYTFTIPWRVADGVKLDMDVRSESEHIQGYSFNLAGPTQDDSYTVSSQNAIIHRKTGYLKKNGIRLGMVYQSRVCLMKST